jgi:hypothetical protein
MVSKTHSCIHQELVSCGLKDPPALECRCRKFIGIEDATKAVMSGEARWVVKQRIRGYKIVPCRMCTWRLSQDHLFSANCPMCFGEGTHQESLVEDVFGDDIVFIVTENKRILKCIAKKFPRVPTIEQEHILRAYVEDDKHQQDRIDEYGLLNLKVIASLMAPFVPDPYEGRAMLVSFSVSDIHVSDDDKKDAYIFNWSQPLLGLPRGVFKQGISSEPDRRFEEVNRELRISTPGKLENLIVIPEGGKSLEDQFKIEFARYRLDYRKAAALGLPYYTEWYDGQIREVAMDYMKQQTFSRRG